VYTVEIQNTISENNSLKTNQCNYKHNENTHTETIYFDSKTKKHNEHAHDKKVYHVLPKT